MTAEHHRSERAAMGTLLSLVLLGALWALPAQADPRSFGGVALPNCVPNTGECDRLLDERPKPKVDPRDRPVVAPPPVPEVVLQPRFDPRADTEQLIRALSAVSAGGRIILRPGEYTFSGLYAQMRIGAETGGHPPFLPVSKPVTIEGLSEAGNTVISFIGPRCISLDRGFVADEPALTVSNLRLSFQPEGYIEELSALREAQGGGPVSDFPLNEAPACLVSQSGLVRLTNVEFDLTGPRYRSRVPDLPKVAMLVENHMAQLSGVHVRGSLTEREAAARGMLASFWSDQSALHDCRFGGVGICVQDGVVDMQDSSVEGMDVGVRAEGGLRLTNTLIQHNIVGAALNAERSAFGEPATHQVDGVKLNHNFVGLILGDGYDGQFVGGRAEIKNNHAPGVLIGSLERYASCEFTAGVQVSRNSRGFDRGDHREFVSMLEYWPMNLGNQRVSSNDEFVTTRAGRDECNLPRGFSQFLSELRGQSGNNKPSF